MAYCPTCIIAPLPMYLSLKYAHLISATLGMLATLAWAIVAWNAGRFPQPLRGIAKGLYIANRASTGIAGLTGLFITYMGPWHQLLFPYIGLAAFLIHSFAATHSKRAYTTARTTLRPMLALQVLVWLFAAWLMSAKVC